MSPAARRAPTGPKGAADASTAPVVVTGPPRRLLVALPADRAPRIDTTAPIEATLEGATIQSISLSGPRRRDPGGPRIKLRLDPLTPPGRYEGTATVGGLELPIVAEVQPRVFVRHEPAVIELEVQPGATAELTVTLQNLGNVPTGAPEVSSFTLLDREGFSDAFYRAIGPPPPEGKQRVDVFFDDLAASNGGEVRATVVAPKSDRIAPGDTATLTLRLAFAEKLRPGAQYAGAWNIDATHVPVRITVPDEGAPPTAPTAPVDAPSRDPKPSTRSRRRKEAPSS